MRELTMLLLLLGVVQLAAAKTPPRKKTTLDLTPQGQTAATTEDPGSATRLLYEDPRNQNSLTAGSEKKMGSFVKATCTDNMGMIYKNGDTGYDSCIRTFGSGIAPSLPGDNKRPNSLGITIGR